MPLRSISCVSVRLETGLYEKLRYIAFYKGRSINGQLRYEALCRIRQFEAQHHGKITPQDLRGGDPIGQ